MPGEPRAQSGRDGDSVPGRRPLCWCAGRLDRELKREAGLVRKLGGRGQEGSGQKGSETPERRDERSRKRLADWCCGPGAKRADGGRKGPEVGRAGAVTAVKR